MCNKTFYKYFSLITVILLSIFIINCETTGTTRVEKPKSNLFKTIEDLVDKNDYLVLSYTIGNIIEDFTYDVQMQSSKSFNIWSWTGTSEELNCMIIVKSNDEIVAQIYSSDEKDKANIMANGFRGKKNVKVIFLDDPSTKELIESYNKMINGSE